MKISKILFTILTIAFLVTATEAQRYEDGDVVKEERTVSDFTSVSVGGGIDLYISMGKSDKIQLEVSSHAIDKLKTEVKRGELKIYYDGRVRRVKKSAVYISVDDLERITASGGSDVESKGTLKFNELEIQSSGGSDVELDLEVKTLVCHTSGGSDVDLQGSANTLELQSSGGSDFDGFGFKTKDAVVHSSGGADANVYASESIEVHASGASDVSFRGDPKKTKLKSSGASDIDSQR